MSEYNQTFEEPQSPIEVSEVTIRNLLRSYADSSKLYRDSRGSPPSKLKGITDGKTIMFRWILGKIGQEEAARKIEYEQYNPDDTPLAPITQLTTGDKKEFLDKYNRLYKLSVLSNVSLPKIDIRRLITGTVEESKNNYAYSKGMIYGRVEVLQDFLQGLGLGLYLDMINQYADKMGRRDPKGLQQQLKSENPSQVNDVTQRLREATEELAKEREELSEELDKESNND